MGTGFEPISYFIRILMNLQEQNIVNAILVDFRGFDTMLEILVLSMGGRGFIH